MTKEIIQSIYPGDYQTEEEIEQVAREVENLPSDLKKHLDKLLAGSETGEIEVEGYTARSIMRNLDVNIIEAVVTLNKLRQNPDYLR